MPGITKEKQSEGLFTLSLSTGGNKLSNKFSHFSAGLPCHWGLNLIAVRLTKMNSTKQNPIK